MGLKDIIRVGTRGSALSLRQTDEVINALKVDFPNQIFKICEVKTGGDLDKNTPLTGMGMGIFVNELERLLLESHIDMAVHSLKDVPTKQPDGLSIEIVGHRQDPRDVLVNRWKCTIDDLPSGARVGTSSPRRTAQILNLRRDLTTLPIRGNVETRIQKCSGVNYDGTILAAAGIARLGITQHISEYLSPESFVPAPGQGALAVEFRCEDKYLVDMSKTIKDENTIRCVTAERALLKAFGSGCQIPIAGYAQIASNRLVLNARISNDDGTILLSTQADGKVDNPLGIATEAYHRLIAMGANDLLFDK